MPLNEADTRAKLIDPAIHVRGWNEEMIRREETAGAIEVIDGRPRKRAKGRIDYFLRIKTGPEAQPVAVALIEAKAEHLPPDHGLEQGKLYAACWRFHVPFVFSTNGHQFVEFDHFNGLTTAPQPMHCFPTPEELRRRYELGVGFNLADPVARPLVTRYHRGEGWRRYYQDAAIRAVFEKLAQDEMSGKPRRALLSLATGSGKTFIAVNILKRLDDAGQLKQALFLCDRDELRSQALNALQNAFGADAAEVFRESDGKNHARNARVHVATYQTLDIATQDGTANLLSEFYPEGSFSHIIIDECHRSAWGKWSEVLRRNPDAVQIGLTATPRQLDCEEDTKEAKEDGQITADNIKHFGEPVYEYDMAQGIEDGYLAACEIQRGRVNIDDTGLTFEQVLAHNPRNAITGAAISAEELKELYQRTEYEDRIMLPDRVSAMCEDLFKYLVDTGGPEQKTIIFCVRDSHADQVATEMNNLYATWCQRNAIKRLEPYAFKCTASVGGNQFLADLRGASRSHFIAATVDLLSTGVDVPSVRNIVFFKYVRSPIAFYQMVGRGTRIDPATNKLLFRIYDYTDATRLFGREFVTKATPKTPPGPPGPPPRPPIVIDGVEVHITDAGRFIVTDVEGRAMPVTVEEYKERLAARLTEEFPTIESFRACWIDPARRNELMTHLPNGGTSVQLVSAVEEMQDYDGYDILAEIGYGLSPRTRAERAEAFGAKASGWLQKLPPPAAATIKAIASQFARGGTDGLENPHIFQTPEVEQAGGLEALRALGQPAQVLTETKKRMFAA